MKMTKERTTTIIGIGIAAVAITALLRVSALQNGLSSSKTISLIRCFIA
jgi:hypothetical protein